MQGCQALLQNPLGTVPISCKVAGPNRKGVESAWRDAMDVAEVLHDATPEQNRMCAQLPEMHAMNKLLHEQMKGISAHIGKGSWSLQRRAHAM